MLFGKLSFIFEVMLYVGLGLPLINVLLSLLGGLGGSGSEVDGDFSADTGLELEADLDLDLDLDLDVDLDVDIDLDLDTDLDVVDLGTEALDISGGTPRGVFLRFNIHCLCLALVVMGAMGVYAMEAHDGVMQTILLIAGAAASLLSYTLLYRLLVLPLKKNKAEALKRQNLLYQHARVTFRILRNSPGKIQTTDAIGAMISYAAELDPQICKDDRIDEGEEVIITEIIKEKSLCYVMPAQNKILKK